MAGNAHATPGGWSNSSPWERIDLTGPPPPPSERRTSYPLRRGEAPALPPSQPQLSSSAAPPSWAPPPSPGARPPPGPSANPPPRLTAAPNPYTPYPALPQRPALPPPAMPPQASPTPLPTPPAAPGTYIRPTPPPDAPQPSGSSYGWDGAPSTFTRTDSARSDSTRFDSARGDSARGGRGTSRVKVFVRVRPFLGKEHLPTKDIPVVKCCVDMTNNVASCLDPADGYTRREGYKFDRCFWSFRGSPEFGGAGLRTESQCDVYTDIGNEMLDNMFQGFNTCMFCYGQTGSGKTYTMMGKLSDREERGMIPRLCEDMFWRIRNAQQQTPGTEFKVEASYFEIYNEKVRDLLRRPDSPRSKDVLDLKVRQHPEKGPYVEGLSTHRVTDLAAIFFLMQRGSEERTTHATCMNDVSSRSHAIFTITFEQTDASGTTASKMNLVDLAGSERTSMIDSARHFKESTNINMSLTTLGRVIDALVERNAKQVLPPYRDSALTWLLSESLGGNSRTFMMATVSPAPSSCEETLSTLRYSSRARRIVNQAHVNTMDDNHPVVKALRQEVSWLRAQLETAGPAPSAASQALQRQLSNSEGEIQRLRQQLRLAVPPPPQQETARGHDREALLEENRQLRAALERERAESNQRIAELTDKLAAQSVIPPQRSLPAYPSASVGWGDTDHRTVAASVAQSAFHPVATSAGESAGPAPPPAGRSRSRTPLAPLNGVAGRPPAEKGGDSPDRAWPGGAEPPRRKSGAADAAWKPARPYLQYYAHDTEADMAGETAQVVSARQTPGGGRPASPAVTRPPTTLGTSRPTTPRRAAPYFGLEIDLDADPSVRGVTLLGAHGPAADAGLRSDDVIIGVGSRSVVTRDDLKGVLFVAQPGDVLPLRVLRGQQLLDLNLRAGLTEEYAAQGPTSAPPSPPHTRSRSAPLPPGLAEPRLPAPSPGPPRQWGAAATGATYTQSGGAPQPGAVDSQGRRILNVVERAYFLDADGNRHDIEEEDPLYPVATARSVYGSEAGSVVRSYAVGYS